MFASSAPLLIAVRDQVHGLWLKKKGRVCRVSGLGPDWRLCAVKRRAEIA